MASNTAPVTEQLEIYQGAKYEHTFRYQDANGNAIDITNYKARMQFRESYDADTKLYEATTTNGHITIDGSAGEVQLAIPASSTAGWSFASALYDLEIEHPSDSDDVKRLAEGSVVVYPEITK